MKYALIGCGRIAPNHIAAAKENGLNIVALCDLDEEKANNLIEDFQLGPNTKVFTDYKELLKEEIDFIAIATESGNHGKIALDCIASDKHLIIEKPITLSLEEADEIIAKAEEKELVVCACHQNRFNRSIQKLREAIEGKRFGRLLHGAAHIRWNRGEAYYEQAPWRGTWGQDGGALMNQCIHNIDLLRWMMGGEIEEVYGITDNKVHDYIEAEDVGLAIVKFTNGSLGIVEGTTYVYPKNLEETLYLFGENGTVKVGGKSVNIIEEWDFHDGKDNSEEIKSSYRENPPNVYGFGHIPLYADVIGAIREGRPPYITARDGRDALELILAIYQSSATGLPVKLPLKSGSTLDYIGRFNHE